MIKLAQKKKTIEELIADNEKLQRELDKVNAELERRKILETELREENNTLLEKIKKLENDLEVQGVKETSPPVKPKSVAKKQKKEVQEVDWGTPFFFCAGCGKNYIWKGLEGLTKGYQFPLTDDWKEGDTWIIFWETLGGIMQWKKGDRFGGEFNVFKMGDVIECAVCPQKIKFIQ